jgi:SAM-dependent methyltransferase
VPDGALVVDAPCGAGVAFSALPAHKRVRYVALDISAGMLGRARRRADELGLHQIELVQADAEHVPIRDGTVDLFLSYWGLHCMPDPARAVAEVARCLKPGGRLVGAMICSGPALRQRLLVRPGRGDFGPVGTPEDLASWIDTAGLESTRLDLSGPFAYFEASA